MNALFDQKNGWREVTRLAKYPFFASGFRTRPIEYSAREGAKPFHIRIWSERGLPLATVHDADIMAALTSIVTAKVNSGKSLDQPLEFRPAHLLQILGRDCGGRQHKLLAAALERLHATAVLTSLVTDVSANIAFNLLERNEQPTTRHGGVWTVSLAAWITTQIASAQIIKIAPEALLLRGIERRLYSIARAHAGGQGFEKYRLDLRHAHAKLASIDAPRKFRHRIRVIAARNRLPGFDLAVQREGAAEFLVFSRYGATEAPQPKPLDFQMAEITAAELGIPPGFFGD